MQRTATGFFISLLVILAGCEASGPQGQLGPAPMPILSTRTPPRVVAIPPPKRPVAPKPRVRPRPPVSNVVQSSDVRVQGGINRGKWQVIVVHHSASAKATPRGMDHFHRRVRKWSNGLGYHFVIGNGVNYPDGELHVGRRWKKQMTGAHCRSGAGRYLGRWRPNNYFNEHGIGICLIGNFEKERPTAKQLATLRSLIRVLSREAGVSLSEVWGHGEVTHKTACPGRNLDMDALRRAVARATGLDARAYAARWLRSGTPAVSMAMPRPVARPVAADTRRRPVVRARRPRRAMRR